MLASRVMNHQTNDDEVNQQQTTVVVVVNTQEKIMFNFLMDE